MATDGWVTGCLVIDVVLDPIENRLLLGDTDFRKSNAVLGSLLKWGTVATEEQYVCPSIPSLLCYGVLFLMLVCCLPPLTCCREKLLQNMKIQLQQLEFNVSKTDLMVAMEEEEAANFRVIYSDIGSCDCDAELNHTPLTAAPAHPTLLEQQIAQAHKDIEEEQSRLVDEKIIQRNKQGTALS